MRSITTARMTIARPASRPLPTFSVWMPTSTSSPSPRAPIIEAITTIDRAIMVVWLIPAMMLGRASGNCTPNSCCQRLAPKALTASITSLSTWRMPRSVRRISGGAA